MPASPISSPFCPSLQGVALTLLVFLLPSQAEAVTLEQAWVEAYRNNPSLEAQRANLRAIDEQVSQALSNWRPSIDATGSVGKTNQYAPELAPFENPHFTGTARSYGVQLKQPLFRGFRTQAETDAARKQVLAARAKLESAEQQLLLDTASAYLAVLRDLAVLELERHHEAVLTDTLEETRVRARTGELTGTDVRQAESRLARAHVSTFQAENSLTQDRASYLRLVGTPPPQWHPDTLPGCLRRQCRLHAGCQSLCLGQCALRSNETASGPLWPARLRGAAACSHPNQDVNMTFSSEDEPDCDHMA